MTSDRRVATKPAKRSGQARVKSSPAAEESTAQPVALLTSTLDVRPFDEDARRQLIAEAAYYHAARRGFEPGGEVEDWLAAEAEVDARLCGDTRSL
jgi:hypothetical protein